MKKQQSRHTKVNQAFSRVNLLLKRLIPQFLITRASLIALVIALLSPGALHAVDDIKQYEAATTAYSAGDYKKALDAYDPIALKSAHIYFNMGNAAYKLGRRGYALLYWRKAERLWGFFGKQELVRNIALLKAEQAIAQGKDPQAVSRINNWRSMAQAYFYTYLVSMPLLLMQLLFLFLWLFLFVYIRYLYRRRYRALVVTLFSLIAFFGTLLAIRYGMDHRTYGVVVAPSTDLYAGPGQTFPKLGLLSEGHEVVILREEHGFYKLRCGRRVGCVAKEAVKKVTE